jgi:hypothetical protein
MRSVTFQIEQVEEENSEGEWCRYEKHSVELDHIQPNIQHISTKQPEWIFVAQSIRMTYLYLSTWFERGQFLRSRFNRLSSME